MSELLEVIRQEIEAREISEGVKANVHMDKYKENTPKRPTNLTLLSHDNARLQSKGNQIKCVYCGGFHYSASCENVSDPHARFEILKKGRRCFVCLKTDHHSSSCKRNCRRCQGNHHQSICRKFVSKTPDYSSDSSGLNDQNSREVQNSTLVSYTSEPIANEIHHEGTTEEGNETPFLGSAVTATSTARTKGSILLQTATTTATNNDRSKTMTVRILFDSGSQRSYITDSVRKKLGLKSTSTEILHLKTFGENAYPKQRSEIVTLPLRTIDDEYVEITALDFPIICSPMPKSVDLRDHPHLLELELAENAEGSNSIDIFIGLDHYRDFVTGESIRGDSGPTAVTSKLGWLLSGPTKSSHSETNVVSNLVISGETMSSEARENNEMVEMLKRFWEVESLGIVDTEREVELVKRKEEVAFKGRHYEVGLPSKEGCLPQSNHYGMCVTRLQSFHSKLKKEPNLLREYDNIIQEQRKKGIIEIVPTPKEELWEERNLTAKSPRRGFITRHIMQ